MHFPAINIDRYIAFLLSTLPKLAERRVYSPRWPFPMRNSRCSIVRFARRGAATELGSNSAFSGARGGHRTHKRRQHDRAGYCAKNKTPRPNGRGVSTGYSAAATASLPAATALGMRSQNSEMNAEASAQSARA
jgi:hypothetical protein